MSQRPLKARIVRALVQNRLTWAFFRGLHRFADRFRFEKELIEIEKQQAAQAALDASVRGMFSSLEVQSGPFQGMKYPGFEAHGSSLYAKLLGSYEAELHPALEAFRTRAYTDIIDVGCAEGYYAVGLARMFPQATVWAYDIEPRALALCGEMSRLNGVEAQVKLNARCTAETLKTHRFSGPGLVVVDCEGYERELFRPDVCENLRQADVLIELHDLYDERITPTILDAFAQTHDLRLVLSENSFLKARRYPALNALREDQVKLIMQERNGLMHWAILTPKS